MSTSTSSSTGMTAKGLATESGAAFICGLDAIASSTTVDVATGRIVYGLHRIPCSETGCPADGVRLVYYRPHGHGSAGAPVAVAGMMSTGDPETAASAAHPIGMQPGTAQGVAAQVHGWFFCPSHAETFASRLAQAHKYGAE